MLLGPLGAFCHCPLVCLPLSHATALSWPLWMNFLLVSGLACCHPSFPVCLQLTYQAHGSSDVDVGGWRSIPGGAVLECTEMQAACSPRAACQSSPARGDAFLAPPGTPTRGLPSSLLHCTELCKDSSGRQPKARQQCWKPSKWKELSCHQHHA